MQTEETEFEKAVVSLFNEDDSLGAKIYAVKIIVKALKRHYTLWLNLFVDLKSTITPVAQVIPAPADK